MANKWISVKDALPEEYKGVLVHRENNVNLMIAYRDGDRFRNVSMGYAFSRVDYWQPLPDPPNEGE